MRRLRLESKISGFVVFLRLTPILVALVAGDVSGSSAGLPASSVPLNQKQGRRLAQCQVCRSLIGSFNVGLDRTAKGHYGGGDTAWEEENKKVYKDSELRLVEIQEGLCNEVGTGKDQCFELATENDQMLEDWWSNHRKNGVDLYSWLCIEQLKVCCPDNHFGSQCLPCMDCNGHGRCKGNGTRKGNGECNCDAGYEGKQCNGCALNYYQAYKDEDKVLCSACHKSCQGGCSGPGGKGCVSCKEGWEADEEQGCMDLNECILNAEACTKNQFCVNNEGSYSCIPCDKSCNGCNGDGPDMCDKCADGYFLKDKLCIDGSAFGHRRLNTQRYITYLGLCVAVFIILQKSVKIALIIGFAVGVYIATSEYMLSGGFAS